MLAFSSHLKKTSILFMNLIEIINTSVSPMEKLNDNINLYNQNQFNVLGLLCFSIVQ